MALEFQEESCLFQGKDMVFFFLSDPVCLLQYAYPDGINLGLGGSSGDRGSYFSIFWPLNRGLCSPIVLEPLVYQVTAELLPFLGYISLA